MQTNHPLRSSILRIDNLAFASKGGPFPSAVTCAIRITMIDDLLLWLLCLWLCWLLLFLLFLLLSVMGRYIVIRNSGGGYLPRLRILQYIVEDPTILCGRFGYPMTGDFNKKGKHSSNCPTGTRPSMLLDSGCLLSLLPSKGALQDTGDEDVLDKLFFLADPEEGFHPLHLHTHT